MSPRIKGVLETPVYVDDLSVAHAFYHDVLGLERMVEGERIYAYSVAAGQVLIVCLRGAADDDAYVNGSLVPGHRSDGPSHFAFRIEINALDEWIGYLGEKGIEIESRVEWPLGGISIYFRDPFDNVVELATGGVWPNDPADV